MTLHAATINGVERVYWATFCDANSEKTCYIPIGGECHYPAKCLPNLHPVSTYNPATHKVVPKDAMVIELFSDEIEELQIRKGEDLSGTQIGDDILNRVYEAIAQLTPPRPEEPKGFGAIVEAECRFVIGSRKRFKFVRMGNGEWYSIDTVQPQRQTWSDLIAPVIISEGVENA